MSYLISIQHQARNDAAKKKRGGVQYSTASLSQIIAQFSSPSPFPLSFRKIKDVSLAKRGRIRRERESYFLTNALLLFPPMDQDPQKKSSIFPTPLIHFFALRLLPSSFPNPHLPKGGGEACLVMPFSHQLFPLLEVERVQPTDRPSSSSFCLWPHHHSRAGFLLAASLPGTKRC